MCMRSSSEAKPASPSSPANNSSGNAFRDPSWLKLDVCPDYLAGRCLNREEVCPLAHPSPNVNIIEGTITCCFDFIKDRCHRTCCRYYHPSPLIKDQLVTAGKMHAHSRTRGKELSASAPDFQLYSSNAESAPFSPLLQHSGCVPYFEKVEVCREYMRGRCHRKPFECRFYHPGYHTVVDPQNMVLVCPTLSTSGACKVSNCQYGHPLRHHKLQRVSLNPYLPYGAGNSYMQTHHVPISGASYYPMTFSPFPNVMYPSGVPTSMYPNQIAQMMPMNYQPYSISSTPLWTPPPMTVPMTVFFGSNYIGGTEFHPSANKLSETGNKSFENIDQQD